MNIIKRIFGKRKAADHNENLSAVAVQPGGYFVANGVNQNPVKVVLKNIIKSGDVISGELWIEVGSERR